jgi:hypothetical protein
MKQKSFNKNSSGLLAPLEIFLEKWYNIGAIAKSEKYSQKRLESDL